MTNKEKQFIELPLGFYTLESNFCTYNMEKYSNDKGENIYCIWTDDVFKRVLLFEREDKIVGMSGVGAFTVHGTVDLEIFNKIIKTNEQSV